MNLNSSKINVMDLFSLRPYLRICAPMVRYSKLQFRQLVRLYDCDLTFTPMILADSFILSDKARANEFTTSTGDSPLIVQFAANNINDFVGAAKLISLHCNGVDLNCGCPQRWAKKLNLGSELMKQPELVCSMVQECIRAVDNPNFTISVKTRIHRDLKHTIDFCQKLDRAGVSFLSIHGRTPDQQSSEDINADAIKLIGENVSCPIIANGGINCLNDCETLHKKTKCKGVMVADGLLINPTLFTGVLPSIDQMQTVIEEWIQICYCSSIKSQDSINILELGIPQNITFQCFHHHLVFMLSKTLQNQQKRIFNNLRTFVSVLSFINDNKLIHNPPFIVINHTVVESSAEISVSYDVDNLYIKSRLMANMLKKDCSNSNDGAYFNNFMLTDLFA